ANLQLSRVSRIIRLLVKTFSRPQPSSRAARWDSLLARLAYLATPAHAFIRTAGGFNRAADPSSRAAERLNHTDEALSRANKSASRAAQRFSHANNSVSRGNKCVSRAAGSSSRNVF